MLKSQLESQTRTLKLNITSLCKETSTKRQLSKVAQVLYLHSFTLLMRLPCQKIFIYFFLGLEGDSGELLVRGPNVFATYWQRPQATKEAFTSDGWFKTGRAMSKNDNAISRPKLIGRNLLLRLAKKHDRFDIGLNFLNSGDTGCYIDGTYKIMGRTSVDIIKSGGYKISALDIERHLLTHKDISEAVVVGLPDLTFGQRIAAILVLTECSELSLEELRTWCKDRMPRYQVSARTSDS